MIISTKIPCLFKLKFWHGITIIFCMLSSQWLSTQLAALLAGQVVTRIQKSHSNMFQVSRKITTNNPFMPSLQDKNPFEVIHIDCCSLCMVHCVTAAPVKTLKTKSCFCNGWCSNWMAWIWSSSQPNCRSGCQMSQKILILLPSLAQKNCLWHWF